MGVGPAPRSPPLCLRGICPSSRPTARAPGFPSSRTTELLSGGSLAAGNVTYLRPRTAASLATPAIRARPFGGPHAHRTAPRSACSSLYFRQHALPLVRAPYPLAPAANRPWPARVGPALLVASH